MNASGNNNQYMYSAPQKEEAYNTWYICLMFYYRVFSDRLVEERDTETFVNIMTEKLGSLFDQTYHNICPNKQPPIFGELQSEIVLKQTESGEGLMEYICYGS